MSGQYLGTIRFWNSEKRFGFASTDSGEEFYVGAAGLTHLANIEGTRMQFDREVKSTGDWIKSLNDGKLRDMGGIDSRNPRPPRRTWTGAVKKPAATNVVVIEEKL